jgi:uncharacterized protein YjiS (DUF1127 family)
MADTVFGGPSWLRPLRRVLRRWVARRTAARAAHMLSRFGDGALKDIGLSRGDLPAVRVGLYCRDATRRVRGLKGPA